MNEPNQACVHEVHDFTAASFSMLAPFPLL
jgi:hypothetical protein